MVDGFRLSILLNGVGLHAPALDRLVPVPQRAVAFRAHVFAAGMVIS